MKKRSSTLYVFPNAIFDAHDHVCLCERHRKLIADTGRQTVGDLIRFLYLEDLVGASYIVLSNNCQRFARNPKGILYL